MSLEKIMQKELRNIRRRQLTIKEVSGPMDTIPTKEFNDLFRRLAVDVDLKGRTTVADVNNAIRHSENMYEKLARYSRGKRGSSWDEIEKYFWTQRKKLRNLRERGIGRRIVSEAKRGNRKVRKVLRYGLDETLERNLSKARDELGELEPIEKSRRRRRRQ